MSRITIDTTEDGGAVATFQTHCAIPPEALRMGVVSYHEDRHVASGGTYRWWVSKRDVPTMRAVLGVALLLLAVALVGCSALGPIVEAAATRYLLPKFDQLVGHGEKSIDEVTAAFARERERISAIPNQLDRIELNTELALYEVRWANAQLGAINDELDIEWVPVDEGEGESAEPAPPNSGAAGE